MAHAQTPAPRAAPGTYDIPAGPLAQALSRFAQLTGTAIVVDTEKVKGLHSPGLKGQYRVEDGFNALLGGTGLVIGKTAAGYLVLPGAAPGAPTSRTPVASGARAPQEAPSMLPVVTVVDKSEMLADQLHVRERMDAVSPTVIVDRSQIDVLGDKRLSDIAGRLPGAFAGGPPGEKKSINLRGVSSEFARFSFDGFNLPSSTGSRNIDLQRISSFIVEDVTYLRSPSAEYEGDGLAGRLAFRTRAVPDTPEFEADVSAGGLNRLDGSNRSVKLAYAGKVGERFGVIAALGQDRFDSIKIKDRSERTYSGGGGPAQNLGTLVDEREPKRNHNLNLFLDLVHYHRGGEIHLKPVLLDTLVESTGRQRDVYNRVPGTFRQRTLAHGEEDNRTTGLTLDGKHRFEGGVEIDAALSRSSARRDSVSSDLTLGSSLAFAGATSSASTSKDDLRQLTFNVAIPVPGAVQQRIKLGVMRRESRQVSDAELFTVNAAGRASQTATDLARSRNSDYEVEEDYSAFYVQDEIKLGRLTLLPGLRNERVAVTTSGVNALQAHRQTSDWLPSLPVSYRVSESLQLRASVAKHINRPKLDELAPGVSVRGNRTFTGNPDLLPAVSRSIDVGFDYSHANAFYGVNLFHRSIKNLNETLEPTPNNFVYRNAGDGFIRGIEFDQRFALDALGPAWLKGLSITANQAFLNSRVNDPTTGPRPFSEQPRFIANLIFDYKHAPTGLSTSLGINRIGKRGIVSNEGAGQIKDKTIRAATFIDARVQWQMSPQLAVYASVANLTNQKRDEFEYVNGQLDRTAVIGTGRTYFIGLKWRM
ncbi:MAG: TonB-dependent receptor [Acidovorax sp.]|nr:TonB-dependent receptor [Acidovorax sp.]